VSILEVQLLCTSCAHNISLDIITRYYYLTCYIILYLSKYSVIDSEGKKFNIPDKDVKYASK